MYKIVTEYYRGGLGTFLDKYTAGVKGSWALWLPPKTLKTSKETNLPILNCPHIIVSATDLVLCWPCVLKTRMEITSR